MTHPPSLEFHLDAAAAEERRKRERDAKTAREQELVELFKKAAAKPT